VNSGVSAPKEAWCNLKHRVFLKTVYQISQQFLGFKNLSYVGDHNKESFAEPFKKSIFVCFPTSGISFHQYY